MVKCILVTSRYEEASIRSRCERMGVKIILKPYVPYIKTIQRPNTENKSNLIFIDDDEMMRFTWLFAAEEAGISISTFSSFDDFLNEVSKFEKSTPIYIDSDLGNDIKGELCAKQLFDEGFFEIYLCTGYSKDRFCEMPWIKAVVGKEPLFLITDENLI